MIRKLKNILKSHDNNNNNHHHNSSSQLDVTSTDSISSSKSNTTDHSKFGSPKMNFIKRSNFILFFFKFIYFKKNI